jgi:hypothetical protein
MSFLIFLKWNGSIVVGDKSAHEAVIHLPQVSVILVRLQKKNHFINGPLIPLPKKSLFKIY